MKKLLLPAFLLLLTRISGAQPMTEAEIKPHNGRPTVFLNGVPTALPAYSPVTINRAELSKKQTARFFPHHMGAYFISVPPRKFEDWAFFYDTPFWVGDKVSSAPLVESQGTLDEQVSFILASDPNAHFIVRFGIHEPKTWRDLHPEQSFVTEEGKRLEIPSLASRLYNEKAAEYSRAIIAHCESRPWANHIIGYSNFLRVEGTHEPVISGWMFDHSELMTERWREYLRGRYRTVENLRAAWDDPQISFDAAEVPRDKLRRGVPEVSALLYFQNAKENQPLRDYLLLTRDLFHEHFRLVAGAMQQETEKWKRKRILTYDALKIGMMGWANAGFFDPNLSWPLAYPEDRAASGHLGVSTLFGAPGMDGLITPHDYQARGAGGVYEPEGAADSTVLRGKYFFSEMDTRTYAGTDVNFPARNDREFAAVTWRNLAAGWTRGFNSYWMDVYQDWFASEAMHKIIDRQVQVIKQSVNWKHHDVPGIAVILDDEAILETNGNGQVFNEAVMWDLKMGLARCGVPYRVYLFDDLKLPNFPKHKLFYFPNLYRIDDARLELLQGKVLRDGNLVVWGPGSGISDGTKISADSATKLTGFDFHLLPVNYPRRTMIANFEHPITRGLSPDTFLQNGVAFGPCLYPKDGTELGRAFTKGGRDWSGLSVKEMNGWKSIFSTTTNFSADLWRNLALYSGTHVYTHTNDILLADSTVVALHSIESGRKRIELPGEYSVVDVVTGKKVGTELHAIQFDLQTPQTRVFRLLPP